MAKFFNRAVLILVACILVFCLYAFLLHKPKPSGDGFHCDTIHIGVLHITTGIPLFEFLKVLLHYRNSPIHFHFSVNATSERMVRTLFETWGVPQVNISTYHTGSKPAISVRERVELFRRPTLLRHTSRLIIMDTDLRLTGDVDQLWNMFQETLVVGVVKDNQTQANVILADLEKLSTNTSIDEPPQLYWNYMRKVADLGTTRDIGHGVPPRFLSRCQGFGYTTKITEVLHCAKFPESKSKTYKRTTLLMIRHFEYAPGSSDVTLVTHLSYDKLPVFEDMCRRWRGPVSVALYIAEENFSKALDFIKRSSVLHRRHNIAYHAVITRGRFYPANLLRNVALRNVVTSHVFPLDVDFMPNLRLHELLVPDLLKLATRRLGGTGICSERIRRDDPTYTVRIKGILGGAIGYSVSTERIRRGTPTNRLRQTAL
ncbi:LARGE xylosyl- and glucuronyltransferase 1-like isoform X2 [Photinus pyralis]|uniref:LARGE xylosyl- and glucuronyltransferase 1-like isoform X2 n=1 Tax=Photinus pyralis TaxID=7054 RepID=UPI0012672C5C|nr:LARGE xylosyl- and glucuronyltransferase 1-like isoform X2 [Photinus pyralis]